MKAIFLFSVLSFNAAEMSPHSVLNSTLLCLCYICNFFSLHSTKDIWRKWLVGSWDGAQTHHLFRDCECRLIGYWLLVSVFKIFRIKKPGFQVFEHFQNQRTFGSEFCRTFCTMKHRLNWMNSNHNRVSESFEECCAVLWFC